MISSDSGYFANSRGAKNRFTLWVISVFVTKNMGKKDHHNLLINLSLNFCFEKIWSLKWNHHTWMFKNSRWNKSYKWL